MVGVKKWSGYQLKPPGDTGNDGAPLVSPIRAVGKHGECKHLVHVCSALHSPARIRKDAGEQTM